MLEASSTMERKKRKNLRGQELPFQIGCSGSTSLRDLFTWRKWVNLAGGCPKQKEVRAETQVGGSWYIWGSVRRPVGLEWSGRGEHGCRWGQIRRALALVCSVGHRSHWGSCCSVRRSAVFSLAVVEHYDIWMYRDLFTSVLIERDA